MTQVQQAMEDIRSLQTITTQSLDPIHLLCDQIQEVYIQILNQFKTTREEYISIARPNDP